MTHATRCPDPNYRTPTNLLEEKGTMMSAWFDRLRFLWEEETAPAEEAVHEHREEPAGVPQPLRRATRFALIGLVGTTLMAHVIGVRLIAPVDAQPAHSGVECVRGCASFSGPARAACIRACRAR